jgi:hypothetical protein
LLLAGRAETPGRGISFAIGGQPEERCTILAPEKPQSVGGR